MKSNLFASFFLGGFDCSSQINSSGQRLDLLATTEHDRFARDDYLRLRSQGMLAARDGIRWHRVERAPGQYDFSSVTPMLAAARETGMQVIYDLAHYGWPDDLDLFSPAFVRRYANYVRAVARVLTDEMDGPPWLVPINEISFWAWGAGDVGYMYPFARRRGAELKRQLVRAAIEGIEAVWSVNPQAHIVFVEPLIHIHADPTRPQDRAAAEARRLTMYEAWDMLTGRSMPELGGQDRYLQIVGVNFYPHNQWMFGSEETIYRSHPLYRPLRDMLQEVHARYRRPMFISETTANRDQRPGWLRYVGQEVRAARRSGVPLEGICLYPILNYPSWEGNEYCEHGLWGDANEAGERSICEPLARELRLQTDLI